MKTVIRLLRFLAPFRWRIALAVLLACAAVASNVGLLGMAAYLIAAAALKPLLITLTLPIYIVRFMSVSRALSRYAERLLSHDATFRLLARLRVWLYTRLEPLVPARLLEYRSGDVLARLVADVEELQNVYLRAFSPFLVAILIAALTYAVLHIFSPALAWTGLAFLAAAGIGVPLVVGLLTRGLGRRQLAARARLQAQIVDTIQGLPDLLACGRADDRLDGITALDRELGGAQRRVAMVEGLRQSLNDTLMNAALCAVLVLAIPLVGAGSINGVYLGLLALVTMGSFEAVQPLGEAFQVLGRSLAAGERVFAVADAAPRVATPVAPLPAPVAPLLELKRVRFAYGPDEALALDDVNFCLRPGQRIAVVGPSGAGKSTLARLALRYWDPNDGAVLLDGHDLRDYALEDVRRLIGVVEQDTYIFNDTLRGNLLLARPDATEAEIALALERAQLLEFVRSLPDGLHTWVGEQGLRLSGGERQRLAIARALLKDAPLLILDEATANLDPLTERALLDAFDALMRGRTVLVITHRLVAMERMDEILVLDGGRIIERGTHAQLRAAGGLYQQMLRIQDEWLVASD